MRIGRRRRFGSLSLLAWYCCPRRWLACSVDGARDLATALTGYTFMTLSTGVPVDSEDLHRFVRRQFAIYSVRGHATAGSNPTPTRGH